MNSLRIISARLDRTQTTQKMDPRLTPTSMFLNLPQPTPRLLSWNMSVEEYEMWNSVTTTGRCKYHGALAKQRQTKARPRDVLERMLLKRSLSLNVYGWIRRPTYFLQCPTVNARPVQRKTAILTQTCVKCSSLPETRFSSNNYPKITMCAGQLS